MTGSAEVSREPRHLVQANFARLRYPLNDPRMAELIAAIDHINGLAEQVPGFIWRWQAPDGHFHLTENDPRTTVNLSVWTGYQPLHEFTYRGPHGRLVRRQRAWFAPIQQPSTVLWWINHTDRPTPAQAAVRVQHLRRYGPTDRAFTVRTRYTATGQPDQPWRSKNQPPR